MRNFGWADSFNRADGSPFIIRFGDPPGVTSYLSKDHLISNMQFVGNDTMLNLYRMGHPVHKFYTKWADPSSGRSGPILSNTAWVEIDPSSEYVEEFEIGMPFHGFHTNSVSVDWQPSAVCQTSYLALGISKTANQYNNFDVFIVQATCHVPAADCDHGVHLEDGRKLAGWHALALLAGWRQSSSSLGTVMAISRSASRIATANWKQVTVWSFNPKLMQQGELQHYIPSKDYNIRKDIGRLRPVLLPSEGVVHSMLWTDDTHLCATTDKGLVIWDVGTMSCGRKKDHSLIFDTRPESVSIAPVTGTILRQSMQRRSSALR